MSNGPSSSRGSFQETSGSSAQRRAAIDRPTHGSASSEADPAASDHTVISTAPPLALQTAIPGLKPHEVGQALEGQQLDHVRLEQFVGGGGMGAVFRAWDTNLHRIVAVKVLTASHGDDGEMQRRFQMEARSAARLDHPNIARVHYVGEDRGIRYIVFEYIDGTNIRDLVYAHGPLTVAEALNYTLQVATALVHAWQRDVVHRDIKPSNILITNDGLAKLVDMGLARFEQVGQSDDDQTATGVTLGTFDYIAPEQARDPRNADARSDIYSLGCTLYFMLAGQPPFPGGTALQKLLQHQGELPPDVRQFRPDVPEAVVHVLESMWAKQPVDRFANPADVAAALVASMDQIGVAHPPIALPAYWSDAAAQPTWLRRHAPWLVPSSLLVVGVGALAVWWRLEQATPAFPNLNIPAAVETEFPAGGAPAADADARTN